MTIKYAIFDTDGALTNSLVTYSVAHGRLAIGRQFNVRDGLGIRMLKEVGIEVWIISQEDDDCIRDRAGKLGVLCKLGIADKRDMIAVLCGSATLDEIAWMGDDLNDMECLRVVGLPACPADAIDSVRALVMSRGGFVSSLNGGHGAVRDFCEHIIHFNGG